MIKTLLLSSLISLSFLGCGSSIKNIHAYKKDPLPTAEFIPSVDIIKGKSLPKVIILDLDESASKVAQKADLGRSLAGEIDKQLTKGKSVEILKRVTQTTINEEIKLAELSRAIGGDELRSANYIIGGSILNASFTSKFQEKLVVRRKGKAFIIPANYHYITKVKGFVKIYEVPSLKVLATLDFEDNKISDEQTSTSYLGLGKTQMRGKKEDNSMVREAGADAINTLRIPLKNFFAKKGYIFEKRSQRGDSIVKVTLGAKHGAKKGEKVKFYAVQESLNPLTKEKTRETIEIGEGVISDKIRPESSWVIVSEIYEGKQLKAGDFIQLQYKKEISDFVNSAGKTLNNSGILRYKDTALHLLINEAIK